MKRSLIVEDEAHQSRRQHRWEAILPPASRGAEERARQSEDDACAFMLRDRRTDACGCVEQFGACGDRRQANGFGTPGFFAAGSLIGRSTLLWRVVRRSAGGRG